MGSWRLLALGWAGLLGVIAGLGLVTSLPAVIPPVAAAGVVLMGAALACDYFGFSRRALGWNGRVASSAAARARLAALEHRFLRERDHGSMSTGATARSLLVAMAELGQLRRSADVVDFLHADALTRAHRDPVGDALRALALAELGRGPQARRVLDDLDRHRAREPVVVWARARVAELEGRLGDALAMYASAVPESGALAAPERDLALEEARVLVRMGAGEKARVLLTRVASAGWSNEVAGLLDGGDASLGLVAQEALGLVTAYR
jgi:hypothetical protein